MEDNPFVALTERQLYVVTMLSCGWTQAEIARGMGIRRDGVCRHVQRARKRIAKVMVK